MNSSTLPSPRAETPLPMDVDIDEAALADQVLMEQIRQFMTRERMAALSGLVPSLYMALMNLSWIERPVLIGWCLTLWAIDLSTVVHTTRFLRHPPATAREQRRWSRRQTLLQVMAGVVWGATVPLFATPQDLTHESYNYIILVAVGSVAVMALLPLWGVTTLFSLGLWCAPLTYLVFWRGDTASLQLSAGIGVLLFSLNFYTWTATQDLVQGIERRFRADALARALHRAAQRIHELATRDELTGILNRREGMRLLEQAFQRWQHHGEPLAVLLLDIDHFKRINDTHGHATGDAVLREFCQRLSAVLPQSGILARVGGEEFLIALPNTPLDDAWGVSQHLLKTLQESPLLTQPITLWVTASFGLSQLLGPESVSQCLARTDAALYAAKHQGRNRVVVASAETNPPEQGLQPRLEPTLASKATDALLAPQ